MKRKALVSLGLLLVTILTTALADPIMNADDTPIYGVSANGTVSVLEILPAGTPYSLISPFRPEVGTPYSDYFAAALGEAQPLLYSVSYTLNGLNREGFMLESYVRNQIITESNASQERADLEGSQINSPGATVYAKPNGSIVDSIPAGTIVTVTEAQDGWVLIDYYGAGTTQLRSGWVKTSDIVKAGFVEPVSHSDSFGLGYVLCESLSVRMEPNVASTAIAGFSYGQTFGITEIKDTWYKVNCDGTIGWVNGQYVLVNPQYYATQSETAAYAYPGADSLRVGLIDANTRIAIIADLPDYYCVSVRGASAFIRK